MMAGQVVALHAMLPVIFRLEDYPNVAIEFVVDTGFTGYLTLPAAAIAALQLPYIESIIVSVATDEEKELDVHAATIFWHDMELDVRVLATGKRPLLGTALLNGYELVAQFAENGLVTVDVI